LRSVLWRCLRPKSNLKKGEEGKYENHDKGTKGLNWDMVKHLRSFSAIFDFA
jgi:hypothetical protein